MDAFFAQVKWLPLFASAVTAWGAAWSAIPEDLTSPVQQRIAMKGPDAIAIGWNTYQKMEKPCVQYGPSSDNLCWETCSTISDTYPSSRTWSNSVTLTGLAPTTTYYYKIVSTNSSVEHFVSPRVAGDKTPFAMAVVIDLGVYGDDGFTLKQDMKASKRDIIPTIDPSLNHTTIGRLAATIDDYELVVHPGDFAYADDWFLSPGTVVNQFLGWVDGYEAILEQFYDQLAPIAGRKVYMASPGNHEADCEEFDYTWGLCPEGQKNFTDFNNRFGQTMPTAFASSSTDKTAQENAAKAKTLAKPPFWYSFEYGMVHMTMIDTETDFADAPDGPYGSDGLNCGPFGNENQQLEFLEADLASVDRTVTPWLIVSGHRPWYATGGGSNICAPCQKAFESLIYKYGVDFVITGHVHNSQRFPPAYNNVRDPNGQVDPKAPMYIVAGGAGNIEGLDSIGKDTTGFNVWAHDHSFAYGMLSFLDENNLQFDFIESETGELIDRSHLFKSHKEQFVRQDPADY